MLEDCCAEVVGLVPEYGDQGDGCRIICRAADGQVKSFVDYRTVESAKRILARCYALDLAVQARLLQRDYHRSPPLPFYFSDGRIFVPFKLRLARISGDASYGFIELDFVSRIIPGSNGRCQLILSAGEVLPVYSHITTARLALYFGMEIKKTLIQPQPDPDQELLHAFHTLRRFLNSGSN